MISYWEDGKIRGEAIYKEGLLHGTATTYDQNGELTSKRRYIYGKEDSTFTDAYFDHNIILDSQAIYIDTLITNFEYSR